MTICDVKGNIYILATEDVHLIRLPQCHLQWFPPCWFTYPVVGILWWIKFGLEHFDYIDFGPLTAISSCFSNHLSFKYYFVPAHNIAIVTIELFLKTQYPKPETEIFLVFVCF